MHKFMPHAFLAVIICCLLVKAQGDENNTIEIRTIGIPPYGIKGGATTSGIYYDVANRLAEDAGYKSNNYLYPYARIIGELKSGDTDLTIMFKYEELDGYVEYVAPLPALHTVIVALEGTTITSVEDLKGKSLAYLRGARFGDEIDDDPSIRKHQTNDFVQGAEMLVFGRVDAIIGPIDPIRSAVESVGNGEAVLGEPFIVSARTPWIQVSKMSTDRLDTTELRAIYAEMVNRGEFESIRNRYTFSR